MFKPYFNVVLPRFVVECIFSGQNSLADSLMVFRRLHTAFVPTASILIFRSKVVVAWLVLIPSDCIEKVYPVKLTNLLVLKPHRLKKQQWQLVFSKLKIELPLI